MRTRTLGAFLVAGLAAAACGASPSAPSGTPSPPGGFTGEAAVRELVEQVLDTMQQQSYKRYQIDWPTLRAQVLARSAGATRMVDAYPAIELALTLLDDPHTIYVSATGTSLRYSKLDCNVPVVPDPAIPSGIGYLRVGTTLNTVFASYAGALQSAIRAADRDDTIGWIVDLRGNGGGSSYAMVAGVGPILGDGTAGFFITPDGVTTEWGYRSGGTGGTGATSNGFVVVTPTVVYQLRKPNPRVAVLSDRGNGSAGEATLISFIGRPNTRTFGTGSCGLSTGNSTLTMKDGARLLLATAIMADRYGRTYGGVILPDDTITDQAQLIARAVQWLQTGQ